MLECVAAKCCVNSENEILYTMEKAWKRASLVEMGYRNSEIELAVF